MDVVYLHAFLNSVYSLDTDIESVIKFQPHNHVCVCLSEVFLRLSFLTEHFDLSLSHDSPLSNCFDISECMMFAIP
jgi:hypothetical protein